MADQPLKAYPPIQRIIKQEMPVEHLEANRVEEENWTLEVHSIDIIF